MHILTGGRMPDRILYVHASADRYGSDNMLLLLLAGLDRRRFEPLVVLPYEGPLAKDLREMGIEVHIMPVAVLRRRDATPFGFVKFTLSLLLSASRLGQLAHRKHVTLIHTNTCVVFGGAIAAALLGIPHVWHVHEIVVRPTFLARLLPRIIARLSQHVVAISEATATWVRTNFGRANTPLSIVYNGIDTSNFKLLKKTEAKTALGLAEDRPLIGLVGRINRWKGHSVFVKAAALLAERYPQAQFIIVGDCFQGEEHFLQDLLKEIARYPDLDRNLRICTFHPRIWEVYSALDILAVPSTEPEPFGLVAIEAMAMGVPVVASSLGGLRETIIPEQSGLLVPPSDEKALAKSLARILDDEALRIRLGAMGKERQQGYFSSAEYINGITQVYAQALKQ